MDVVHENGIFLEQRMLAATTGHRWPSSFPGTFAKAVSICPGEEELLAFEGVWRKKKGDICTNSTILILYSNKNVHWTKKYILIYSTDVI